MGPTSDIYTLLRLYAKKMHRTLIPFDEFCAYLRKYAVHYAKEKPDLEKFTKNPADLLSAELENLSNDNKVILKSEEGKQTIVISAYFKDTISERYKLMAERPYTPYPIPNDLPKDFPQELIVSKEAADILFDLFNGAPRGTNTIYALVFKREIAPVLLPDSVAPEFLLKSAIAKLRILLHRSEQHDYFLQKLMSSNAGREISVKNFFNLFITNEDDTIMNIKEAGDSYYFWNQLFLFVRHDYEKIKDRTPEDVALLQAVYIAELCVAYYKNRSQENLQRETALKNLELAFTKSPYFFDAVDISKFVDSRGVPLLGQYSEEDLNEYLRQATTSTEDGKLPLLLTVKTPLDGSRYYIHNEKVLTVAMKLCTEARKRVHDTITKEWYGILQRFSTVPAMKDFRAFNYRLEEAVKKESPVLYALLNSPFMPTLYDEAVSSDSSGMEKFRFFNNGVLLPYSELLMLSQASLLTDAKILLPVWYTIPVLSFILSLFFGKPKLKKKTVGEAKKKMNEAAAKSGGKPDSATTHMHMEIGDDKKTPAKSGSKKDDFKFAAAAIEKQLVPPDSSLDSELTSYLNEWNHLLDKDAKKNLTEDVNSLIRDYLRKILRSTSPSAFTAARVRELSETLVKTPALQKINDQENLQMYVQLYMLRLIKKG